MQEGLNRLTQTVMELEAAEQTGAGRYPGRTPGRCERTPERRTYRNGHRERVGETRVGEIPLRIPKVRDGTCFPSLLEPRRRSEKALLAVIQLAYVVRRQPHGSCQPGAAHPAGHLGQSVPPPSGGDKHSPADGCGRGVLDAS